MKEITEGEALHKAAAYCSTCERCTFDVTEKLDKWGIDVTAQKRILDRLTSEKFIDEERFCKFFINDKFKFNKWGKLKIGQALYQKKIPSIISGKYLDEIDEQEYLQILRDLIAAKKRSTTAPNNYQLNIKLMRFAVSRGFEMDIIHKCLNFSDEEY